MCSERLPEWDRAVAKPGIALAWGARGPEFKSRQPDQITQAVNPASAFAAFSQSSRGLSQRLVFMAGIIKPITDQERIERQARVARAVASVRLEGLEPNEAARAIFDRYIAGDLTTQEMAAEIRALNTRQFGPIHVSGD